MLKHKDHFHGSDLEKIEEIYGIKKEDITSFSANVNPLGLSPLLKEELSSHLDVISSYPDREYKKLRSTIADYCSASPENVLVGNGSTELISLFIKFINPKKALILGPTYSEYEREIALGGGNSMYFPLEEEDNFTLNIDKFIATLDDNIDLIVMCNPNNPTSSAISRSDMRRILDTCLKFHIFVLVDETYIEFTEEYDKLNCIKLTQSYNNIVILRGISKFFAAPGLRLGYAVCGNIPLLSKINSVKDPWTINSLAEIAGQLMFSDSDYINASRELISSERKRVTKELSEIDGIKVYPPCANFVLCRIEKENVDADILFDMAIRQNLMIRNCSSFPFLDNTYFRLCFMNPSDNDKLIEVIRKCLSQTKP